MSNKDRLYKPTIELLKRAGLYLGNNVERKLCAGIVDPDVTVLSARIADIPECVRDGVAEVGTTGLDRAHESGHEPEGLLDLEYGKCRFALVTSEDGDIRIVTDVSDKVVAIEFPHTARIYSEEEGIDARIAEVTDATELTPHVEMVDVIIGITSTEATLRVNRLVAADEVLPSSVRLFTRPGVVDDPKVQQLLTALESVRSAEGKRHLMMSAPCEKLDEVKEVIPGLGGSTVMDVAGGSTVVVHTVVNERDVFEVVNDLKNVGVSGILVTEIEQLVE